MGCVYLARCVVNGKGYVGKTVGKFEYRKEGHKNTAYDGCLWILHRAIRKHGWDAFEWSILTEDDDNEFLCFMEQRWIKRLGTKIPNGYNMTDGGEGQSPGWNPPKEHLDRLLKFARSPRSEKHKENISRSLIGHPVSDETKEKLRQANTGRLWSEESRKKLSETQTGHLTSEETKKKIGDANRGHSNRVGYKHSEETKKKIRESNILTWANKKLDTKTETKDAKS